MNHLKKKQDRAIHDNYATPPEAIQALLDREIFYNHVLEPACGAGHISKVLERNGYVVTSSDIRNETNIYGTTGLDFFRRKKWRNGSIVTNPPYCLAVEFVRHCIEITPASDRKIALLLRLSFLETEKRRTLFTHYPLKVVYVFSKRLRYWDGMKFVKQGGQFCHAWYVWESGYEDIEPVVRWL